MNTLEFEPGVRTMSAQPERTSMGLPKLRPRMTVDEYLAFERAAEERHVYLDGEVFAMAGESSAHGDISVDLVGTLAAQLKGTAC
jgi:Uma2 family endonuclease